MFKDIPANQVKVGDHVYGKGAVKEVNRLGDGVELVWPGGSNLRLIACRSQWCNSDTSVRVWVS